MLNLFDIYKQGGSWSSVPIRSHVESISALNQGSHSFALDWASVTQDAHLKIIHKKCLLSSLVGEGWACVGSCSFQNEFAFEELERSQASFPEKLLIDLLVVRSVLLGTRILSFFILCDGRYAFLIFSSVRTFSRLFEG